MRAHDSGRSKPALLAIQIEEMGAIRDDLLRQVAGVDASIAQARFEYAQAINRVALVASLPNEVLSFIFQAVFYSSLGESEQLPAEILLSQVTRHWRDVALSTPQLWTRIHFFSRESGKYQMSEAYLSRSGALPIDMRITFRYGTNHSLDIASATKHVGRWSRLQFNCHIANDLSKFLALVKTSTAPCLRRMDMSIGPYEPYTQPQTSKIFVGGTPSLTHVHVRGIILRYCLPSLTTVTHLRLHEPRTAGMTGTTLTELASALNCLPSLTHLVLTGSYINNVMPETSIQLLSLRFLKAQIWGDLEVYPNVLHMISAPLLQHMLLESIIREEIDIFVDLLDPAAESPKFPSLQSLTFLPPRESSDFEMLTWTKVMRAFPTSRHFTLSYDYWDDLFAALRPSVDQPLSSLAMPWCNLHTLTLIGRKHSLNKPSILYDMVLARIASGYPIRKIQVSKGILSALGDTLEGLRAIVEVEETTRFQDITAATFAVDLSDDED